MTAITIKKEINQKYLCECLVYGKNTGRFTWLKRPIEHFVSISACNTWNGKFAGEDACRIDATGYQIISIDGISLKAHHAAFIIMEENKPEEVDHINGIRSDNSWVNIRSVTRLENTKNRKLRSDNPSGYPGVAFRKEQNKWRAKISHKGKRISLGQFVTEEEAILARKEAEIMYGYHVNHGRAE